MLQKGLRKQGLKQFHIALSESLYRLLQKGLRKQGLKLYASVQSVGLCLWLQKGLRKQGLKQSETHFGVSDTFPA